MRQAPFLRHTRVRAPRTLDTVRIVGHAFSLASLVWLGVSQPRGGHKQRWSAALLFMVLMAQGSHFVEAMDHPVVAVEAEHVLVKAAKAAHKTSDRNAEAVKAELQGSLSTSVDADRDMHAGESVAEGANQVVAPSPSRGANTSLTEPLSVLSGNSHGTSNAGSLATPTPQLSLKPPSTSLARRQLVQSVGTVANLRSHLSAQTAEIELEDGTYELGGTQLEISHDVIIRAAPGATVILDGGGFSRVFKISGGHVALSGLSITGGSASSV